VQTWDGRARSRCRCGTDEPGPGADVGGASVMSVHGPKPALSRRSELSGGACLFVCYVRLFVCLRVPGVPVAGGLAPPRAGSVPRVEGRAGGAAALHKRRKARRVPSPSQITFTAASRVRVASKCRTHSSHTPQRVAAAAAKGIGTPTCGIPTCALLLAALPLAALPLAALLLAHSRLRHSHLRTPACALLLEHSHLHSPSCALLLAHSCLRTPACGRRALRRHRSRRRGISLRSGGRPFSRKATRGRYSRPFSPSVPCSGLLRGLLAAAAAAAAAHAVPCARARSRCCREITHVTARSQGQTQRRS
jgi:hypothetical protein